MLKTIYIYHRNGTSRAVSYQAPDPTDPPAVQDMFARFPPYQMVNLQLDTINETLSPQPLAAAQVSAQFVADDSSRAIELAQAGIT